MHIPYSFFRPGNGCFGTHSGAFCRLMVTSEMLFDEKYFEFDAQNCFMVSVQEGISDAILAVLVCASAACPFACAKRL